MTNIEAELAHCVGDALKAVHLQADACGQNLLLEIKATAAQPLVFMPGQRD